MNTSAKPTAEAVLEQSKDMMAPLVRWLMRSGIGYMDFIYSLKTTFFEESLNEIECLGIKQTTSAISLMSGLHRKDVAGMQRQHEQDLKATPTAAKGSSISLSAQVITRWLTSNLPHTLPLNGDINSFESLVRQVSTDVHPAAVASELKRLGLIAINDANIELLRSAYTPDLNSLEISQLLIDSISDHLRAGINNISANKQRSHLEQSVFADGLTRDAVKQLEQLSNQLWLNNLKTLVDKASQLTSDNATPDANYRFRLGMYSYSDTVPYEELSLDEPTRAAIAQKKAEKERKIAKKLNGKLHKFNLVLEHPRDML